MRPYALASLSITAIVATAASSLPATAESPSTEGVPVATPKQPQLSPRNGDLVPAAIDGVQIEETPMVVDDEFVVRFEADVAMVIRTFGTGADGTTGFAPVDDLAEENAVNAFRPLFPGADPFKDLVRGLPDMSGWFVVSVDTSRSTRQDAMRAFEISPYVAHVEEIGVHPVAAVPNDGNYANQWFLNQTSDKDIDAPEGWDIENGSPSIVVAVLDTGVRYFHKDLGGSSASYANPTGTDGNIWINTAEKNGVAGVDDDSNGYVDDWVGYDFVTAPVATCWPGEDCNGADNDPRDFNGHGTHCAGIVSAINNNGYAVCSPAGGFGSGSQAPTADGAKTMCLRIGHSAKSGNTEVGYVRMDSAASAFYYAANKGARIASCSWGSSNTGGLGAAVTYFINAGGLVFKAAGNSNNQTADYLCSRSDVYSVAATNSLDKKASYSSYGTWVDISAPGDAIYSTYHNHAAPASDYIASLSGTSMATPLVASVAAAVWSKHPTWTRTQVWSTVQTNVDDISALNPSYGGKLGSGRVNLQKALVP